MEFLLGFGAYILGSIPFGLIVGRLVKGVDLRRYGSGNIGTTNVMRVLGGGWAALVFAFDAAKGLAPVAVAQRAGLEPEVVALVAFLAVAGHNWPVFLRFRGGKGVATSLGALAGLSLPAAGAAVLVWAAVVLIWGYASLGSMLALLSAPLVLHLTGKPGVYVILGALLFVTAVVRHRANIQRLLAGEELRFGQKVAVGQEAAGGENSDVGGCRGR